MGIARIAARAGCDRGIPEDVGGAGRPSVRWVDPDTEWVRAPAPVAYAEAVESMQRRAEAVRSGVAAERVWLLEHPAVYTAGTSAVAGELFDAGSIPVEVTGRGGRYTYHGPGQRIAYVILDLARRGSDVRRFVWQLEEWVIRALGDLGVQGERRPGRIGIWVETGRGEAKIAALGLRLRRWVSTHGIAVNMDPDLAPFRGIVPCGIREYGVTSLREIGCQAAMPELDAALWNRFGETLGAGEAAPVAPGRAAK